MRGLTQSEIAFVAGGNEEPFQLDDIIVTGRPRETGMGRQGQSAWNYQLEQVRDSVSDLGDLVVNIFTGAAAGGSTYVATGSAAAGGSAAASAIGASLVGGVVADVILNGDLARQNELATADWASHGGYYNPYTGN